MKDKKVRKKNFLPVFLGIYCFYFICGEAAAMLENTHTDLSTNTAMDSSDPNAFRDFCICVETLHDSRPIPSIVVTNSKNVTTFVIEEQKSLWCAFLSICFKPIDLIFFK